jgi:hypothetical protein
MRTQLVVRHGEQTLTRHFIAGVRLLQQVCELLLSDLLPPAVTISHGLERRQ